MSGGSFDYVSTRDPEGVPGEQHEAIVEALAKYQAPGAAEAVEALLDIIKRWREAAAAWEAFSPILKAVEWDHSGDWGPEEVELALAKWMEERR